MAGNIKGITIEFQGDTTRLDKALRQVNNSTKDIDKELKAVNKALKFNPSSVELWQQKQDLLKKKIKETEKNLESLRDMQRQMDAQGVDKQSEAYRAVSREIVEAESKLKTFNNEARKIGNVKLKALSSQFAEMGSKLEAAGQQMRGLSMAAAAVVGALGALTVKSGAWADDINTMSKVYSIGTDELQKYSAAASLVDVEVETIAASHVKLERSMNSAKDGTGATAEAFKTLGVDVTNADGSLRESDAVWQDVISKLGSMTNETERDTLAMQLMGKSAAQLNPLIEDGGETYKKVSDTLAKYGLDYIDQETLDQANQFNDSIDMIKTIGLVTFQSIGTELAGYLAPVLEKVVDLIGRLAEWLSNLSPQALTIIGVIASVIAVAAPLLIGLGKLATGISAIINLVGIIGPAIGGLASGALLPIIGVIAAVIAVGVLLYKNWDVIKAKAIEIKDKIVTVWNNIKTAIFNVIKNIVANAVAKFGQFKNSVTTVFNAIKQAITHPIETAKALVQKAIDKIKSFFPFKIGKIMSGIKLPHFKLNGKFSLNPPSVPKIGIDWYDKGGIFSSPTVIGVGEKRPEFVGALDDLRKIVREEAGGSGAITINVYASPGMNVNDLAAAVERKLIESQNRRRLAWQ